MKLSSLTAFAATALLAASLASSCAKPESFQNAVQPKQAAAAPAAPAASGKVLLGGEPGKIQTVESDACKADIFMKTMLFSCALKAGASSAPLLDKACFIAWGENWARLLEQGALSKPKASMEMTPEGGALAKISGSSKSLKLDGEMLFLPSSIKFKYVLEATEDVSKLQRSSVELGPSWLAVAGGEIEAEMADGSLKSAAIPAKPTKGGAYETILSGKAKSLTVKKLFGIPGAQFKIRGLCNLAIEQTGSQFRWHIGAPVEPGKPFLKGEKATLEFTLELQALPASSLAARQVDIEAASPADASKVSPYVFGAQLSHIGFGVKTKDMRNAWQNNPKQDPEFRKLVQDSGVTFFRIYMQHLYDTLGQCGGATDKDPVCPYEGAPCDYSRAEGIVDALAEMGIEVMPCVGLYCPPWLSTQRKSSKYSGLWMIHRAPPKDNEKWAGIIAGMVRHFNVERKAGIKLWQVGNEPNDPVRYWVGGTMPEFEELFKTASKAMKAADPSIKISGPDLSLLYAKAWPEEKLLWKDEFVKDCKDYFDDFSFNCYNTTDFSSFLKDARETLEKHGAKGKSVYIAEYNSTAGDYDNMAIFDFKGAIFIAKALRNLIENKAERASFYAFYGDNLGFFNERDGKLTPRPSYYSFRMHAALARLKNASLLKSSSSDPLVGALACRHEDGKGYSIVLSADNPLASSYVTKLKLAGAEGAFTLKQYVYEEGMDGIAELPARRVDAAAPIEASCAGRSVTLLLLRQD